MVALANRATEHSGTRLLVSGDMSVPGINARENGWVVGAKA